MKDIKLLEIKPRNKFGSGRGLSVSLNYYLLVLYPIINEVICGETNSDYFPSKTASFLP